MRCLNNCSECGNPLNKPRITYKKKDIQQRKYNLVICDVTKEKIDEILSRLDGLTYTCVIEK